MNLRRFQCYGTPQPIQVPIGTTVRGGTPLGAVLLCPDGPDTTHFLVGIGGFPDANTATLEIPQLDGCTVVDVWYETQPNPHLPYAVILSRRTTLAEELSDLPRLDRRQEAAWAAYVANPCTATKDAWLALVPQWADVPDGQGNALRFTLGLGRLNNCEMTHGGTSEGCQVCSPAKQCPCPPRRL